MEWEHVPFPYPDYYSMFRLQIPGGWIMVMIVTVGHHERDYSQTITFIPDPEHEWQL